MHRARPVVRRGRFEDTAACAAILNEWIDATPWMPRLHTRESVQAFIAATVFGERDTFVAVRGGTVCGFLAVDPADDGPLVTALYVAHTARREGVGSALLDAARKKYPAGLALWTFEANEPARAFYAAHGFTEVQRTAGDNEEGLPDVLLASPSAVSRLTAGATVEA